MASRELPRRPSLEHLRNEARDLQRERTGTLSDAQLEVARSYGFPSWPKLRAYVDFINEHYWTPAEAAPEHDDLVDRFLALACLTYTGIDRGRQPVDAAALLDAHPEIATATVHAMVAANEVDALRAAIEANPSVVHERGGPQPWEPLLYAAYARVPGRSTLEAARLLLDAGADPNAGSLWDGRYLFTALTGVLGGGEERQPRHPDGMAFARMLLDAGASPNDTQAVYNGTFEPDDQHLELLFEYGLGTGDPGPWAARLGPRADSVVDYLHLNLEWAAERGFVERVRLLLAHGLDPNATSHYQADGGHTPYELAVLAGNPEIAELLRAAGARDEVDDTARFVGACMRVDRAAVDATRTDELVRRAEAAHAPLRRAAALGRADAVRLMLDVGFDADVPRDCTALHEAAWRGHVDVVRALLAAGADTTIRDATFDGTALDWAARFGQEAVVALLEGADSPQG